MGNLSNPSINRWGLNLFWYNFWYSDKSSFFLMHQDYHFTKLMHFFVQYGLNLKREVFFNFLWYKKNSLISSNLLEDIKKFNQTSFRFFEYKNKFESEANLVFTRKKKKYLYLSKVWTFRFQNWLILNLYGVQQVQNSNDALWFNRQRNYSQIFTNSNKKKITKKK